MLIKAFRDWRLQSLGPNGRPLGLRRASAARAASKQAAHHVEQRIALPRALDPKVHLGNGLEGLAPGANLLQVRRVLLHQLPVRVGGGALHRQQQEGEEVEEGQAREDAHVGARGADVLHPQAAVVFCQGAGEEAVGGAGTADVADEQVRQDGAGGVEGRRVGVVLLVPRVLEPGEDVGRVLCAEDQVAFGLVGLVLLGVEGAGDVVEFWVAGGIVAVLGGPAGSFSRVSTSRTSRNVHKMSVEPPPVGVPCVCCRQAKRVAKVRRKAAHLIISPTNFLRVGSPPSNSRRHASRRPLAAASGASRALS